MLYETGQNRGYLTRNHWRGTRRQIAIDRIAPSKFGFVTDHVLWAPAMTAYIEDRLEPAFALVESQGLGEAGDYAEFRRMLTAELGTGSRSEIVRLSDTLEMESVADDLGADPAILADHVRSEIARAEAQLGHRREEPTLVTFLVRGTYIATALLSGGYFVRKAPYGKICLPGELADDLPALGYQVRRGTCYQIAYGATEGEASRWFLEALVAMVEPHADLEAAAALRSDAALWLPADRLEHEFQSEAGDDAWICRLACEQAHALGRHIGPQTMWACVESHKPRFALFPGKGYPYATPKAFERACGRRIEECFESARRHL